MLSFDDTGNLVLTLDDGSVLNFTDGGPFSGTDTGTTAAPADNPLSAAPWSWVHFRDAKQDYDVSGNYAIVFNDDGTVAVTADCNSGSGSYSLHEGQRTDNLGIGHHCGRLPAGFARWLICGISEPGRIVCRQLRAS